MDIQEFITRTSNLEARSKELGYMLSYFFSLANLNPKEWADDELIPGRLQLLYLKVERNIGDILQDHDKFTVYSEFPKDDVDYLHSLIQPS